MPKAYEEAGVSVEAGYEVVKRIKSHVARTNRPGVVGGIGGFGGLFRPDFNGMKDPILVSGTDGVGTKLKLAFLMDKGKIKKKSRLRIPLGRLFLCRWWGSNPHVLLAQGILSFYPHLPSGVIQ
jgi:hypothetical protein